jgi:hypothetical protein
MRCNVALKFILFNNYVSKRNIILFLKTLFLLKYFVVLFSMKFYNIKTLYVSPDTEQRNVELLTEVDDVVCNFRRISHVLKDMH